MSDAYGNFLKARAELINAWWNQKSPERIARDLSCDATQVALIYQGCGPNGRFEPGGQLKPQGAQPNRECSTCGYAPCMCEQQ